METITLEVKNKEALKKLHSLEEKKLITIIRTVNIDTPALPGEPMSLSAFKKWIHTAEQSEIVTLEDALGKWQKKKNILKKNIK